ncbi:MAG TPA: TIGR03986 family CRISPR-associated RAMP protein [bacterium]|nr:TIGR03986 family CRISPR-associated RAMP protein [bacterium]
MSAPYNFIPINKKVVSAPELPDDFNKFHKNRLSGYIDIKIKTITPLFIRGEGSEFFSINGKPKIPGSSLRGMIRTLIEIVSYSKFSFFDDKRLYYRAVGDPSSLGNTYRSKMIDFSSSNKIGIIISPKMKAGWLVKKNDKYYIRPAKTDSLGRQFYRINGNFITDKIFKVGPHVFNVFDYKKIWFEPPANKDYLKKTFPSKKEVQLEYNRVNNISLSSQNSYKEGCLIASGPLGNKKHYQWIINLPDNNEMELEEEVVSNYENDKQRDERINLLEMVKSPKYKEGIPCFYITDNGSSNKIIAFGHTGFFRLPYEKTIKDHIKQENTDKIDFAEAIFGKENAWATRVFFEDANILNENNYLLEETSPQILSEPKPTAFQHYLEQNSSSTPKDLKHWDDDDTDIRGYKLYWHRDNNNNWKGEIEFSKRAFEEFFKERQDIDEILNEETRGDITRDDKNDDKYKLNKFFDELDNSEFKKCLKEFALGCEKSHYTIITPVKKGIEFQGRIRFENLTEEELGALLFVLDLPTNCYHKLGMAKPLGLGSVKITPELFLIEREERYSSLFDEKGWKLCEEKEGNIQEYKKKFEDYIKKQIDSSQSSLWEEERLKLLKIMLDWNNTKIPGWLDKTRYMDLEEFKNRTVLEKPNETAP